MARKSKEAGFESTLAELEALVARMEAGNLPLEEAMRSFERGVQLTRECQAALLAAQQRVQLLTVRAAGATLEEFNVEGEDELPAAEP